MLLVWSLTDQGWNYIIKDSLLWRNFTKAARNLKYVRNNSVIIIINNIQHESVRLNLFAWDLRALHNIVCYSQISSSSQFQEAGLRLYKLILALN